MDVREHRGETCRNLGDPQLGSKRCGSVLPLPPTWNMLLLKVPLHATWWKFDLQIVNAVRIKHPVGWFFHLHGWSPFLKLEPMPQTCEILWVAVRVGPFFAQSRLTDYVVQGMVARRTKGR